MRVKGLVWVILVLTILVSSCTSKKEISRSNTKVQKELSEDKEQQYYYVFLEANRKKLLGDLNGALALYYQCLELYPQSDAATS